jgi:hypothetical protein
MGYKTGRPTKYTFELAQQVCEVVASSPKSLAALCREREDWPDVTRLFVWINRYPEFKAIYTRARENQVDVSVDHIQDIVDQPHIYVDKDGVERVDVNLLKVKMDEAKWRASKLNRVKYGDAREAPATDSTVDDDCKRRGEELYEKNRKEF